MANPLHELQRLGQSPWHDNIRRDLLLSGKLKKMVDDGWITGLTSNPTIFEQAIGHSNDYDADLERLAREGKSAEEIFYALAVDDIQHAADVFRPVFERTRGNDGFVSIEVAPKLANDTAATIAEARRLWKTVDRPNLMVKIPATKPGVPAIERAIADGLNVNVTLIFSLERYDEVMDAYLKGLIQRRQAGKPVDHVASVASFFVSRVDTAVDNLLDEKIKSASPQEAKRLEALKGKAAIANAKLAYEAFRKKFATETAQALANAGARKQRPLWASTSTKNPAYPDTYYVDALIGPDTVDTMPPATIEAFADHGHPALTLDKGLEEAHRALAELAAVGIHMDAVTKKLEEDGVASFAASFDSLVAAVERRRAEIAARKPASPVAGAPKAALGSVKRAGRTGKGTKASAVRATAKARVGSARKKAASPKSSAKRGKAKARAKIAAKVAVRRTKPAGKRSAPAARKRSAKKGSRARSRAKRK